MSAARSVRPAGRRRRRAAHRRGARRPAYRPPGSAPRPVAT